MKIIWALILVVAFFSIERFCNLKTGGLRMYELLSNMPNRASWDTPPLLANEKEAIDQILDQKFFFLGGGKQSYAFLSQDGKSVLKFFRHDAFSPKRMFLEQLPLPKSLDKFRLKFLSRNSRKEISPLLASCKLAFDELKEETGLIYIHLNKTKSEFKPVTLVDKIGIAHVIDLDATEFVLQKRVDLLFPVLRTLMENKQLDEAKRRIDSLIETLRKCHEKGIGNTDGALKRNFGCSDTATLCLDIGSFIRDPDLKNRQLSQKEILLKTARLSRWLKKYYPELYTHYLESCSK